MVVPFAYWLATYGKRLMDETSLVFWASVITAVLLLVGNIISLVTNLWTTKPKRNAETAHISSQTYHQLIEDLRASLDEKDEIIDEFKIYIKELEQINVRLKAENRKLRKELEEVKNGKH